MNNQVNATVDYRIVGDYLDKAECETNRECHPGEVVQTQIIGNYEDPEAYDDNGLSMHDAAPEGAVVSTRPGAARLGFLPVIAVSFLAFAVFFLLGTLIFGLQIGLYIAFTQLILSIAFAVICLFNWFLFRQLNLNEDAASINEDKVD